MELSQEEKDRIIAEEKLRMETRREFLSECGHGRCGDRHCGRGLFRVLAIVLVLSALFHFWHRPYCGGGPQSTPTAPSSVPVK